jgi:hypothetical protein
VSKSKQRQKQPPPKKTGKAGIKPPPDDDEPLTKPGSPAARGEVREFKPADEEQQQQGELEIEEQDPPAPAQIENGMVLMQFVRVKPIREKGGKRFLNIELSVGLTPESAQLFGRSIEGRYDILMDDAAVTNLSFNDAAPHTIDIAEASNAKPVIHAIANLGRVSLAAVQEKGSGEERTVIRFSFVAIVPQTDDTLLWTGNNHGGLVWVKMLETQGSLLK